MQVVRGKNDVPERDQSRAVKATKYVCPSTVYKQRFEVIKCIYFMVIYTSTHISKISVRKIVQG